MATIPEKRQDWVVLKFGGTSVASAGTWTMIRDLVAARIDEGLRPVVVHSAVGGVSSQLDLLLRRAAEGAGDELLGQILERHLELANDLELDGRALLATMIGELQKWIEGVRLVGEVSHRVQARTMALGELMATTLGAAYLQRQGLATRWYDARETFRSRDNPDLSERAAYLSATCSHAADPELQGELGSFDGVVLTQGFIARNGRGETVLLGRGGSDTSAAYLAARLEALRLEIWTDVPGMFSADPRAVPGARLLKALRYDEAQEIASTGASVLHPRCIPPVREAGIPLWIRSTARPAMPGTVISSDSADDAPRVKAISRRSGITLVSMETLSMWQEVGFLADAFRCFSDLGLSIDLVSTSESNVTVTLDPQANAMDARTTERLRANLEKLCRVRIVHDVAVVSLVGRKIRTMLPEIGPALEVFQENRIHLVSQAASDLNLSFVVDADQAPRLVQQLHGTVVQAVGGGATFGETWEELARAGTREPPVGAVSPPWWVDRREQLIEIARKQRSAFVYDRATIRDAVARLQALKSVDRVFYAIKANAHPGLLAEVEAGGLDFEVVSPGEIARVLELFPEIDRDRILFTPNFAARDEYELGLAQGLRVTLDNLHPLREWGDLFAGRQLLLRIDPGRGRGHHDHVKTAGVHAKFGIPIFEIDETLELLASCGAEVVGLHAHAGSGILQPAHWEEVALSLLEVARQFPAVRMLNLGGGLGVPEKPDQPALDLAAVDASLAAVRTRFDGELWLEPGRYVAAEAGVLISTVTQIKGKGDVRYVGIDTGINSLIRPALYGAYHEIVNLSRLGEPATELVNVVGPICETGDRLGSDRLLPPTREGDVLAIANAGAYGHAMSSRYNLREPAPEFLV